MQIEYDSDWIGPTVELLKCLENTDKPIKNEEIGSIDYIVDEDNHKKLIRAMIDKKNKAAPISIDTIRTTIKDLDEEKYDEAIILSKSISDAAHNIVKQQKNLDVITPDTKHNFNILEILSSIQKKTIDLCKIKCGKAPETKDDCMGKNGRKYECDVRKLSDDATFHAQMKWKEILFEDFNNICKIENEMIKKMGEVN
jgi:hypothetical protein